MADKTRTEAYKVVEKIDLKITAEANLHAVNFLGGSFDLTTEKFKTYRKPKNGDHLYIHTPTIHLVS